MNREDFTDFLRLLNAGDHTDRSVADALVRLMQWGFRAANNDQEADLLEPTRLSLANTDLEDDACRVLRGLLESVFHLPWQNVDPVEFKCALDIAAACANAGGEYANLPEEVRDIHDAEYLRKRQKVAGMGNWKMVAGAIAKARGHVGSDKTLAAAGEWVADRKIVDLGRRAGLLFPGLNRNN